MLPTVTHETKTPKDADFLYLTCEPPVYQCPDGDGEWPDLDIEKELQELLKLFEKERKAFLFLHEVATSISFPFSLSRGARVLHISGHCDAKYGVALEKEEDGLTHFLDAGTLATLLKQDRALRGVKLVFISACYSELIGRAFCDGGVKHVICIEGKEEVLDSTSITFTRVFYATLQEGSTVQASFDAAKAQIGALPYDAQESRKYLLLPQGGDHNIAIWPKTEPIVPGEFTLYSQSPAFTIPNADDFFFGRKCELHYFLQEFHKPLMVIHGRPGIGKTAFVIRALHYISRRSHSTDLDSVVFIRFDRDRDSKELPLTLQIAQHFRGSPKESESKVTDISIEELCKLIKDKIASKNLTSGRKKKALLVLDGLLTLDQNTGRLIDRLLEDTPVKIIVTCVSIDKDCLKHPPLIQKLLNLSDLDSLKLFHRHRGLVLDPIQSQAIHVCYDALKFLRKKGPDLTKKEIITHIKKCLDHSEQDRLVPLAEAVWFMLKLCKGYPQRIMDAATLIGSTQHVESKSKKPDPSFYEALDYYTETGGLLQLPQALVKAASQLLDMVVTGSRPREDKKPPQMLSLFEQQKILAATPSFLLDGPDYKEQKEELDKIMKELKFPGSLKKIYFLATELLNIRLEFVRNLENDYNRRAMKIESDSSPYEPTRRGTLVSTDWQRLRDKIHVFKESTYVSISKERPTLEMELKVLTLFCDLVIAYRQKKGSLEKLNAEAKEYLQTGFLAGTDSSVVSKYSPEYVSLQIDYTIKRAKAVQLEIEPIIRTLRSVLTEANMECSTIYPSFAPPGLSLPTRTKLEKILEEAKQQDINYPEITAAEELLASDFQDRPPARVFVFPPKHINGTSPSTRETSPGPLSPPIGDRSPPSDQNRFLYRPSLSPSLSSSSTPLHTPSPLSSSKFPYPGRAQSLDEMTSTTSTTQDTLSEDYLSKPHLRKPAPYVPNPVSSRSASLDSLKDYKGTSSGKSSASSSPFTQSTRSINMRSVPATKELDADDYRTDDPPPSTPLSPSPTTTTTATSPPMVPVIQPEHFHTCMVCGPRPVEEFGVCGGCSCPVHLPDWCRRKKIINGGTFYFCQNEHYLNYFQDTYAIQLTASFDQKLVEFFAEKKISAPYQLLSLDEKQDIVVLGCTKNWLSDAPDPRSPHRKLLRFTPLWEWFIAQASMLPAIYPIWEYVPRLMRFVQREKADQMLSGSKSGTLLLRCSSERGFFCVDFVVQPGNLRRTLCNFSEYGEMTIFHKDDKKQKQKYSSFGEYVMTEDRIKFIWPNIPKEEIFTKDGALRPIRKSPSKV